MDNDTYKPKPFTQEIAEQTIVKMYGKMDNKRTLCNVIKQAFRAVQEDSYNLQAARDLLLEALWMGQRMSDKLSNNRKKKLAKEQPLEEDEDYTFSIDWSKLDGRNVAQGNWD